MKPAVLAAKYAARTTAIDGVEVVQLVDSANRTEVLIAPSIGNNAYEMKVGGRNILWHPFGSPAELKASPTLCGVPFLAPWANRVDGDAYWVNGARYRLNPDLGNLRRDPRQKPIHGLLCFSPEWQLAGVRAGDSAAEATSRLDFWKHPGLMAQFPFAHAIVMTHRLENGALEVETTIENLSSESMPVAIGFHPYFQLEDTPRDDWRVHLAARDRMVLSDTLIPTGERKPVEFPEPFPLRGAQLDDVFGTLVRGSDGRADFWVEGGRQRITVSYGPKYRVAVVYAPQGREFICFEPMAAPTNAFNLAHAGLYYELDSIAPGGRWTESFWITPSL